MQYTESVWLGCYWNRFYVLVNDMAEHLYSADVSVMIYFGKVDWKKNRRYKMFKSLVL